MDGEAIHEIESILCQCRGHAKPGSVRRQKTCSSKAAKVGCDGAEARLMKAGGYLVKPRWGLGPPVQKQKRFTVLRSILEIGDFQHFGANRFHLDKLRCRFRRGGRSSEY